jgi:hypothetical protein
MGTFDRALFRGTCPSCGHEQSWAAQFKYGYCRLRDHELGSQICWHDAPGRVAPLGDYGTNSGGVVTVPAAIETVCEKCGTEEDDATVWFRDNTLERVDFGPCEGYTTVDQPRAWMHLWTRRVAGSRNEDRLEVSCCGTRWTVVVADGAGGMSGGAPAARDLADGLAAAGAKAELDSNGWCQLIEEWDRKLAADASYGETTVVVLQTRGREIWSAVRSSRVDPSISNAPESPTLAPQIRKPLVGSGSARARPIVPCALLGRLLVATDGLLKYVAPARLASIASTGDIRTAVDQLVAAAALPSGNFHDDVALVLAERHGE